MKFHERFDIEVNYADAQRRFVNRIINELFESFHYRLSKDDRYRIERNVASALGDRTKLNRSST